MTSPADSNPQPDATPPSQPGTFDQIWRFIIEPKNRPVVMVLGAIVAAILIGGVMIKSNITVTGSPCGQTSVGTASGNSINCGVLPPSPVAKP